MTCTCTLRSETHTDPYTGTVHITLTRRGEDGKIIVDTQRMLEDYILLVGAMLRQAPDLHWCGASGIWAVAKRNPLPESWEVQIRAWAKDRPTKAITVEAYRDGQEISVRWDPRPQIGAGIYIESPLLTGTYSGRDPEGTAGMLVADPQALAGGTWVGEQTEMMQ